MHDAKLAREVKMIRDARESDVSVLADAMVRLQNLHVDAFPNIYKPFTASAAASHLTGLLSLPDCNLRVLVRSNQIAGHAILAVETTPASMFKHAQRYGHLTQIEVDPDYRRLGLGRALLLDAEEIAKKHELERIVLDVWAFNDSARDFFATGGYNAFGSKLVRSITPVVE